MPLERLTSTTPMSRAIHLLLVAVIVLAFVGFVVGLRQGTTVPELTRPQRAATVPHPEAVPAMGYDQYDRRVHGPNRDWQSLLAMLPQPPTDVFAHSQEEDLLRRTVGPFEDDEQRRQALAARAQRRAFDGAPPVVPHAIDQMSTASCMACHGPGLDVGKATHAPAMSHAYLPNCTQCHVEGQSPDLEPLVLAENHFEGWPASGRGHRAGPGAPPTVPHPVFMRENCLSCHGPKGAEPIRTTHPWRTNCLQCHAPSAVLDQVVPRACQGHQKGPFTAYEPEPEPESASSDE